MTQKEIINQTRLARSNGAAFNITKDIGILEVCGTDTLNFLNNLLTIDITLIQNQAHEALILTPQASIVFHLWVLGIKDKVFLIVHKNLYGLRDYLEKRIFTEDVTLTLINTPIYYFEKILPHELQPLSSPFTFHLFKDLHFVRLDLSGEIGHLVWGNKIHPPSVGELSVFYLLTYEGMSQGITLLGNRDKKDNKIKVMELPYWERFFSFDKGCYPGQEIITRSRSRSQTPARRYIPFKWLIEVEPLNALSQQPLCEILNLTSLKSEKQLLGQVISSHYSPKLGGIVSWGHLHRDYSKPGQRFPITVEANEKEDGDKKIEIEIMNPLISHSSIFQKMMDIGLTAYHKDDFTTAKEKFTQAAELNPAHPDPWEALAVIAEKNGDIETAIRLNKTFSEKNPNSPLAKTNLSRLYMFKGWIEKAEDEKRKATVLMFKAAAKEKKNQNKEITAKKFQTDLANKKKIFQQVLDMDSEDEIANFGLGKLLFEEKNYTEAEIHFRKTILKNPAFSLAYSFLADCLIKNNQLQEAESMLQLGITQARQQGQMIPLKAMEENLQLLSAGKKEKK